MQPEIKKPEDIDFEAFVSVMEDVALDAAQELCGFAGETSQSQAAAEVLANLGQAGMSVVPTAYMLELKAVAAAASPTTGEAAAEPDALDLLVRDFSAALLAKLRAACLKYGYEAHNWLSPDWKEECQQGLLGHLGKGDPRDVAAYCAFMWYHKWPTLAAAPAVGEAAGPEVAQYTSIELTEISEVVTWYYARNREKGALLRRFFLDAARDGKLIQEINALTHPNGPTAPIATADESRA